jgi:hypothetical protein
MEQGLRGLSPGSSLTQLLAKHRGVRNHLDLPALTERQILAWADAHHARTGNWPTRSSGPVQEADGETWSGVDAGLQNALRGLPGGSSLARLLDRHRGVPILAWCDAFHERTGRWPGQYSGPVADAPGETWGAIQRALTAGLRGLPGGSSLAKLLAEERGAANEKGRENTAMPVLGT